MDKKYSKIIEKALSSFDWNSIFEVSKCFNMGIGEDSNAIPGVKRKIFSEGITKNDIKNELKNLLKHVIQNDLVELYYGPWIIYWVNSEWSSEKYGNIEIEIDDEDNIKTTLEMDSALDIIYSPQRVYVVMSDSKDKYIKEDSDIKKLESMLKKALDSENFELATKIRDLIKLQKEGPDEDK